MYKDALPPPSMANIASEMRLVCNYELGHDVEGPVGGPVSIYREPEPWRTRQRVVTVKKGVARVACSTEQSPKEDAANVRH